MNPFDQIGANNSKIFLPKRTKGGIYSLCLLLGIMSLMITLTIVLYLLIEYQIIQIAFLIFTVAIVLVFSYITYGYYHMSYELKGNDLILRWGLITQKIPCDRIRKLGRTPKKHLDGIRVFGSAIPGYLQGKFRILLNGNYENIYLLATDLNNLISILTENGKRYGVTPEDPEGFIVEIKNKNEGIEQVIIDTEKKIAKESRRNLQVPKTR